MNAKIVIPISVIITIVIVVFSLTQNDIIEKQISPEISESSELNELPGISESSEIAIDNEIESMLDQIRVDKIKNDNSFQPYVPTEREWIQIGPFQMDKSEYALGEKIFVNIKHLKKNDKGVMIFTKIINSTHILEYKKINFDGSKPQQNFYLGIHLSTVRGICSTDEISGNWKVVFEGTEYSDLNFKVSTEILPGFEYRYEPMC